MLKIITAISSRLNADARLVNTFELQEQIVTSFIGFENLMPRPTCHPRKIYPASRASTTILIRHDRSSPDPPAQRLVSSGRDLTVSQHLPGAPYGSLVPPCRCPTPRYWGATVWSVCRLHVLVWRRLRAPVSSWIRESSTCWCGGLRVCCWGL